MCIKLYKHGQHALIQKGYQMSLPFTWKSSKTIYPRSDIHNPKKMSKGNQWVNPLKTCCFSFFSWQQYLFASFIRYLYGHTRIGTWQCQRRARCRRLCEAGARHGRCDGCCGGGSGWRNLSGTRQRSSWAFHQPICNPWCWNIYQHLPQKTPSFVGKYTIHWAYGQLNLTVNSWYSHD